MRALLISQELLYSNELSAQLTRTGTCRWIASRVGLINTMVFTHLPSNVLTILIPLMPSLRLATAMVFLRWGRLPNLAKSSHWLASSA